MACRKQGNSPALALQSWGANDARLCRFVPACREASMSQDRAEPETERGPARALEALACGFIIFMLSNALIGPLLDPTQAGGEDMPVLRLMWLPVYGLILGLALWRLPRLLRFWFPVVLCCLMIGWVFASASWSFDPGTTQRRAIAAAFTTLFGLYFVSSFDGRRMAEIIAATFLILAAGGLLAAIAYPKMGMQHDINAGDWRGLWFEKNQMGAMMVQGALGAVAALAAGSRRRKTLVATLILCSVMVLMSKSKTSLVCLLIVLAGAGTLTLMRRGPATAIFLLWLGVTVSGLAALVMWLSPETVYAALGKDPSLTGRTEIWESLMRQSAKAPLTGYGYAVFWREDSVPANWVRSDTGWNVPTAHNGWLDTLVQLVGLIAATLGLAAVAALFRFRRVADGYWATLYLAIFLLVTFSESFILERNGLAWAMACAAIARLLGPAPAQTRSSHDEEDAITAPLPATPWVPQSVEIDLSPLPNPAFCTQSPTFGRRQGSPFGSGMATGAA
jgi:O-antigen ligase